MSLGGYHSHDANRGGGYECTDTHMYLAGPVPWRHRVETKGGHGFGVLARRIEGALLSMARGP